MTPCDLFHIQSVNFTEIFFIRHVGGIDLRPRPATRRDVIPKRRDGADAPPGRLKAETARDDTKNTPAPAVPDAEPPPPRPFLTAYKGACYYNRRTREGFSCI